MVALGLCARLVYLVHRDYHKLCAHLAYLARHMEHSRGLYLESEDFTCAGPKTSQAHIYNEHF